MSDQQIQIKKLWQIIGTNDSSVLELRAIWPAAIEPTRPARTIHFRARAYGGIDACKSAFEVEALRLNAIGYNIYVVMNPIKPTFTGNAAGDDDIAHRDLFLIDIDRAQTAKQPATDEEIEAAKQLAEAVMAYLEKLDWPDLIDVVMPRHIANTEKLSDANEFDINPFLAPYLAVYLTGELTAEAVAKALVYPRVLGTSITTSLGTHLQSFASNVLGGVAGSLVSGIDIEFIDALDNRRKYCQAKLGPNTINSGDVETIHTHFRSARNLGRTNNVTVQQSDLVVGILFGIPGQENAHYKRLRDNHDYPLFIGNEFWHRLTGNPDFYSNLQFAIAEVAVRANGNKLIEETINSLAKSEIVRKLAGENNSK